MLLLPLHRVGNGQPLPVQVSGRGSLAAGASRTLCFAASGLRCLLADDALVTCALYGNTRAWPPGPPIDQCCPALGSEFRVFRTFKLTTPPSPARADRCGKPSCLGYIAGASQLTREQLSGRRLTDFIANK